MPTWEGEDIGPDMDGFADDRTFIMLRQRWPFCVKYLAFFDERGAAN